ncbi:AMP-binding protein [Streptomyces sp. NPDC055078]
MDHNLWQIFSGVADVIPDQEAIVDGERRFTYRRLKDRSARVARVLGDHGLGCRTPRAGLRPWQTGQDTVALYMLNCAEYLEATYGGYASRTVPFNVNYSYVRAELAYLLNDADAAAVVYHARFAPVVAATLPDLRRAPLLIQVADGSGEPLLPGALDYESALAGAAPAPDTTEADPDDLHLIYTGGTTGMPKGVQWRQGDFWYGSLARGRLRDGTGLDAIAAHAAARRRSRVLVATPLMHGMGHSTALSALAHGDTVVFPTVTERFDAADACRTIERESVNSLAIVGEAFAQPLLKELETGRYDGSSVRIIITGGAALGARSKDRITAALPNSTVFDLLGASETGGALTSTDQNGGGQGLFVPAAGVTVLDAGLTRREEPGHTEVGWFAKSGRIPLGYLGDRARTEATFPVVDGVRWSVPGDRARLRADGLLEVLGRDAATINTGGEKVYAEEVEDALLSHPAVTEAVVTSRPSERWGQEITALVALAPGATVTDDELKDAAARVISRYKLPKAIIRIPSVHRTANGKTDRSWAKRVAEESLPRAEGSLPRAEESIPPS